MIDENHREVRTPPTDSRLISEAKKQPNSWIYDVDFQYSTRERTPPEAIIGAWEVDKYGNLTGVFMKNPNYRPIEICDRKLPKYMHAGARHNPNKWVAEIAPDAESMFPNIPEDKIVGWWYIDEDGILTKQFRPNSKFQNQDSR